MIINIAKEDNLIRIPYGKISEDSINEAAAKLTGDAFKVWIKLAISKSGSKKSILIDKNILDELRDYVKYDVTSETYTFSIPEESSHSNQKPKQIPPVWQDIARVYDFRNEDFKFVSKSFSDYHLTKKTDEILNYWKDHSSVIDCSAARTNPVVYGLRILLTHWVRNCFQLYPGEELNIGHNACNISRVKNFATRKKIQDALAHSEIVEITQENASEWNVDIREGNIEFDPLVVGTILEQRENPYGTPGYYSYEDDESEGVPW